MRCLLWCCLSLALAAVGACSEDPVSSPATPASGADAGASSTTDSGAVAADGRDSAPQNTDVGTCASSFGNALTPGFGRLDGTLVAIVRPQDQSCAMPNRDHVILQLEMNDDVYRMVVNVESSRGSDSRVRIGRFAAPMPEPAFAEGWHTGLALDYADFDAHAGEVFEPLEKDDLVTAIVGDLHIGARVSVYATNGSGKPESAHLIHRNDGKTDGAVVIDPSGKSSKLLFFHFADQSF